MTKLENAFGMRKLGVEIHKSEHRKLDLPCNWQGISNKMLGYGVKYH